MRQSRCGSGVLMGAMVLAFVLAIVCVPKARGAEPMKGNEHKDHEMGGHMEHEMMTRPKTPMVHTGKEVTPKGWRFAMPPGDVNAGRKAFVELECFKCHEVQGENFPAPKVEQGEVGPALSGMGSMHPAEYFAEAILNPNASASWRIKYHKEEKKGYLDEKGKTKMPSYSASMTAQQLVDLVAYLKSLTPSPAGHKH